MGVPTASPDGWRGPGRHPKSRLRAGGWTSPRSATGLPSPHRFERVAGLRYAGRRVGQPYRGPVPNRLSARITSEGGGVLVGRDSAKPADEQAVAIAHDPGGDWHALDPPLRPCSCPRTSASRRRRSPTITAPATSLSPPSTRARRPVSSSARRAARSPTRSSTSTGRAGRASRSASAPLRRPASPYGPLPHSRDRCDRPRQRLGDCRGGLLSQPLNCSARTYRHPGRAGLGGAPAGRDPVRRSRQPRAGDRRRRADRGRGAAADCHL